MLALSYVRLVTFALVLITTFCVFTVAPGWAQSPFPDGVRFADNSTVIQSGQNYSVVMQVLLDGGDYPRANIGIYVVSNNTSVLDIPDSAMAVTNQSGIAVYNLTTDQVKPGKVKVTAIMLDKQTGISSSKNYTIVNTGNISGIVSDSAGEPVPVARVTLYQPVNGTMQIFPVEGNPTYTASNATGIPGSFTFRGVTHDTYYIEASFADQASGINYTLDGSEQPANVTIAGYTIATPTPLPTPAATPSPSAAVTATPAPSPSPAPSSGDSSKQLIWIGGLAAILTIIIVAIVMLTRKK